MISVPDAGLAENYIVNQIRLCAYDSADIEIACKQTHSVIVQGTPSISYKIAFLPAPVGGYYKLFAQCPETCRGFVKDRQYLQPDGSIAFREAQLSSLPDIQNFTLSRGNLLTGEVSLPNGHEVDFSVFADIRLCRYNNASNLVGCDAVNNLTSSSLELTAPTFTDDYAINFLPAPVGGFYELSMICPIHCKIYSKKRIYLQADGTTGFESTLLTSLPGNVNFEMYEEIDLDAYEPDDNATSAQFINGYKTQERNIHEVGNHDWLKFTLTSPYNISLKAENLGDEGNPMMTLYDSNLVQVERHDDVLDSLEVENNTVSSIKIDQLAAGEYYIKLEGYSPTSRIGNYLFTFKGPGDPLCVPIKTGNGNLTIVCL